MTGDSHDDDLAEPLAEQIAIIINVHVQCGIWEAPSKGKARARHIAQSLQWAVDDLTRHLDGPGFDLSYEQIVSDFHDGARLALEEYAFIEDAAEREAALEELMGAAVAVFRGILPRLRQQPHLPRSAKH
jgi:hypothetical protein